MQTIGQLAVSTKALRPDDSLGKAAEVLRASAAKAVPVIWDGRLMGLITPALIAAYLGEAHHAEPGETPLAELELENCVALPEGMSPSAALSLFRANDLHYAPVIDYAGGLIGMVGEAELSSAVCGRIRPPVIGGMATPFGVYLTGGGVRGGVGDLALMTTGSYMAVLILVSTWLTERLAAPDGWLAMLPSLRSVQGLLAGEGPQAALLFLLFALFFRLSWITGFHAAEHQVVHALEAGDDLRPEVVREKPRVHPRCGTNIVAAVMIAGAVWDLGDPLREYGLDDLAPVFILVATLLFWRRLGGWLQQYVTTRPATPSQIENGIFAGRQLMERYQEHPVVSLPFFRRVWNMGILQVFAGSSLVFLLLWLFEQFLPLPLPRFF